MPTKPKPTTNPAPLKSDGEKPAQAKAYLVHKATKKCRSKASVPLKDRNQYRPATPRDVALAGL